MEINAASQPPGQDEATSLPVSKTDFAPATPVDVPKPVTRNKKRLIVSLAAVWVLLMATAWWLFRLKTPLGRDGWLLQPNPQPWPSGAWALPVGVLAIFGGLAALSAYDRCFRAKTAGAEKLSLRLALVALMALSLGWNWSLLGPGGTLTDRRDTPYNGSYALVANAFSDIATQYLGAAYQINDARQWTRQFPAQQKAPSSHLAHVATHPPGAVLIFYGCRRMLENSTGLRGSFEMLAERTIGHPTVQIAASANESRRAAFNSAGFSSGTDLPVDAVAVAMLVSLLFGASCALSVPAVFRLARHAISSDDATASDIEARRDARGLVGAALWVLAPTTALFGWTLDALIACGAAWTLALASKYFDSGKTMWMLAAGAVWGLTVFCSFGALAIGVVVALWAFLRASKTPNARRDALRSVGWLTLGAVATWLVLMLIFPMQPLTIFQNAMAAHRGATLKFRAYWPWLPLNFAFWALFAGWPLLVAAITATRLQPDFVRRLALPLATIMTMLTISLAGSVRGETERLWLFFLPSWCAWAASFFGDEVKLRSSLWLFFPIAQAAQTLMMAAAMAPLIRPL